MANTGCLQEVGSKPYDDNAGRTSMKEWVREGERERQRERERGRERSSGAESTVTTVLCLHYDPSGESQRYVDATHTHKYVHTCARGSTKILHSAHQKSHEDTYLLSCTHTRTHTRTLLSSTQPTCVNEGRKSKIFPVFSAACF